MSRKLRNFSTLTASEMIIVIIFLFLSLATIKAIIQPTMQDKVNGIKGRSKNTRINIIKLEGSAPAASKYITTAGIRTNI